MTNCYNRHYLDENIEHINCVENYPLGIISIDLNNLKLVNDTMGHQKGDYVIQGAASIIRSSLTRGDYLFRMGGDEFLVFVPNTNTQELESMHNFIIDEVKKRCDENCPLTLSFGYEVLYQYDQDLYHGIKKADNRMYEHKRQCKSTLTK